MCDTYKAGDPQKSIGLSGVGIIFAIIIGMFMLGAANESGLTDKMMDKVPLTAGAQARFDAARVKVGR